jgi:calcineurin-like phosphoesterase family protein
MGNRFIVSDHHFMHANMYRYTDKNGDPVRPWAQDAQEADEIMIDAHNSVVRNGDTTYFVGDVAINAKGLGLLDRMAGRKILIRGNHDIFRMKQYTAHFADIRGSHKLDRLILTHYPIHPGSIPHWCLANVHGHTHTNDVSHMALDGSYTSTPDLRYFNACVESMGITPMSVEDVEKAIRDRQASAPPAPKLSRIRTFLIKKLMGL